MTKSRNPNPARKRRRPHFDLEKRLTKFELTILRLLVTASFLWEIYRLIKFEVGW
jgi:hypothetical protein